VFEKSLASQKRFQKFRGASSEVFLFGPASLFQEKQTEQALGSHHMQQEHHTPLDPVEDPTGRNDNFPIQGPWQFGRTLSGIGESFKALHTFKYSFDEV